jgi:hypothetical protein
MAAGRVSARTIEAALRLGSLTANDRYAQPVNEIFDHSERGVVHPPVTAPGLVPGTPSRP